MKLATIQGALEIGLDYQRYVPAAKTDQAASPQLDYAAPHNIGDWFVTKVTDRILAYHELLVVARSADQHDWDIINSECGAMVLKGGNYIQPDWLSRNFGIDLFRKIKIPIILFGVGLQAGWSEQVDFQPEEIEILRYIHDSCACSSVRGYSTAEQLAKIGITNAAVTACPTIYWSRRPEITVRPASDERVGFSFRQSLYSDDPVMLESQFRAIETMRDRAGTVTVILQGEEVLLQLYLEGRRWGAEHEVRVEPVAESGLTHLQRRPLDLAALRSEIHEQFGGYTRASLLDWVMNNSFFSYDVGEYVATYRAQGLVVGCRLHSNLVSLANGTPTMFLTYDQRTKELAELLEIPHCAVTDFGPHVDPFEQDWRPFEKSYAAHFAEMRRFLDSNGLPHRMEP
ncbi:MAG: hypothetical protein JWM55_1715 [Acidimicrobiaceae bacterium]|nr:hypothetical protein [Acidimicrobiaceae bacterium]